jgi:hypothetical protein
MGFARGFFMLFHLVNLTDWGILGAGRAKSDVLGFRHIVSNIISRGNYVILTMA